MNVQSTKLRLPRLANTLKEALGQLLTPAVWKQAHRHLPRGRRRRWELQPLVVVVLVMTWCCGDSLAERFETAKSFCVVCQTKRRRPGKSMAGFQKALRKLPVPALRALAVAVRNRLHAWFAARWTYGEWVPFGVDGSRLQCPLTTELQARMGQANKPDTAPSVWVTALVQLRLGLLWSWRIGKGTASERGHLRDLLPTLPARSLVVGDAGFSGHTLARQVTAAGVNYLVRMCAGVTLWTDGHPRGRRDQPVWYRPTRLAAAEPLRARLLRIRARKGQRRFDVYLLTSVLDARRLSWEQASRLYRWRWQNEGLFRTYKRTLAKVKLMHRSVRLVHREAEGSLLATQLLLALGVWGVNTNRPAMVPADPPAQCSPRQVLRTLRYEIVLVAAAQQRRRFAVNLLKARKCERLQTSPRVKRRWARRYDHEPPKPPKLRKLTNQEKRRTEAVWRKINDS